MHANEFDFLRGERTARENRKKELNVGLNGVALDTTCL